MRSVGIVLQARMGSTRLPGKVLAPVGSHSLLELCVRRLSSSGFPVVIATTERDEDDPIVTEAGRLEIGVCRGPEHDVLARYIQAAKAFGFTDVIRATADNPCVDLGAAGRAMAFRRRVEADHVVECGLPVGAAVEAVSLDALERASALVADPYDREHVTSFIRRDSRFRALRAVAPGDIRRPGLRLTVDTPEDLDFVRRVYEVCGDAALSPLPVIIRAADVLIVQAVASRRVRQGA